jgi:ABC-type phosphate transport system substrate-binding protein
MSPSTRLALVLAGSLAVATGLADATVAASGYKVVVHPSNPVTSLSREELQKCFLRKSLSWPSGRAIAVVDLEKDSPTRAAFSRDVLGKSVDQVVAYWRQQIYAGRAVPPPEKASSAEVLAFVGSHEGAIGYVPEDAGTRDVKVVAVGR